MKNKIEPVINLHFFDPCIITVEQFEAIEKDLLARHLANDQQPGDRVLAYLLVMNRYRYLEIKGVACDGCGGQGTTGGGPPGSASPCDCCGGSGRI